MSRFAIGLGSNLGDRLATLRNAVSGLDDFGQVLSVSALYETEPVGGPEQAPFLNAVVLIDSELEPTELLDRLSTLEASFDRKRDVRWGPRTLDLDLVAWDGAPVDEPDLAVPHPRALEREFVLRPLRDVWPRALVGPGLDAATALDRLGDQGVDLLLRDWVAPASWRSMALVAGQFFVFVAAGVGLAADGTIPEGEVGWTRVAGLLMAAYGAVVAFISSRRLGSSMTASPVPRDQSVLVTSGPFRWVRHPIYGGVALFLIGTALILDSLWGVAIGLFLLIYFYAKSEYEERHLRATHAGYREYQRTVPRRLIPFLL